MISQWKLRATNCSRLVPLSNGVVAVCGPKSAYVMNSQRGEELCRCIVPAGASTYALWIPPGFSAKQTVAIYATNDNKNAVSGLVESGNTGGVVSQNLSGGVFILMNSSAPAIPLVLEGQPLEPIEDLHILYHTVLGVVTRHEVTFYYCDPDLANAAASSGDNQPPVVLKKIGPVVPLAFLQSNVDTQIVASGVEATAECKRFVVVQTSGNSDVWVCRLVIDGRVVVLEDLKLPQGGVPLPPSCELLSWTVNWEKGELLTLVRQHGGDDGTMATVLSLSLDAAYQGLTLTSWDSQRLGFLSAATKRALRTMDDLCCTEKGEVWGVDRTTGPCVSLRHVSNPALKEELLPGSRVSTKVMVVTCGEVVYVLAGCTVYVVSSASTSSTGEPIAQADSSFLGWIQQQQSSSPESSTEPNNVTTLVEWLTGGNRDGKGGRAPEHVVRDFTYIVEDSVSSRYRHAVLDALANRCSEQQGGKAPHVDYPTALVRYLAAAESIHPFTVLKALHHADAPLALGVAAILSRKANLYRGSLQHAPELMRAAAAFFSYNIQSSIEKKRYLAVVCKTALSALAMGALGAVGILFCIADMGMRHIYGSCYRAETRPQPTDAESTAEMRNLEETIAEAINVMSSYSEWALNTASTSLGVMSAHIGEPSNIKKEACMRDGRSHPITTSRTVEIEVFKPRRS
ncbi:unnamed protein product [Phytomonas sp. EM1]|nr:unnamed protein product [Phytomonas sp. EM1]|eukprot:CCW62004.1 unnamed protein product [Phytomonas sp. isolate EM1]